MSPHHLLGFLLLSTLSKPAFPQCEFPLPKRTPLKTTRMFVEQNFQKPVRVRQAPGEPNRWYVAEHAGRILQIENGKATSFLDIRDRVLGGDQWGLQDFIFHPNYPQTARIFVNYVAKSTKYPEGLDSRLSQFEIVDNRIRPESEVVLLSENQRRRFHPIASLALDSRGLLYIAWGDGNADRSQEAQGLKGKVLRLNVTSFDTKKKYSVPEDNFGQHSPYRPEVFAIGFRNPWRISVDLETDTVWLGDVGDRMFEEINRVENGKNYGWPYFEGNHCKEPRCHTIDHQKPLYVHPTRTMASAIGGHIYRGKNIPELQGKYIFASRWGALYAMNPQTGAADILGFHEKNVASIGRDPQGELYLVEASSSRPDQNRVFRLDGILPKENREEDFPSLKGLGCGPKFTQKMLPYSVNIPRWHEGAESRRFFFGKSQKRIYSNQTGPWIGWGILMKELSLKNKRIETQVLITRWGSPVSALSFRWNTDQTDAFLVREDTEAEVDGQKWLFLSQESCRRCHQLASGGVLGLTFAQLNSKDPGVHKQNQKLFRDTNQERLLPRFKNARLTTLSDDHYSKYDRIRDYLHVNCRTCHSPEGEAGWIGLNLDRNIPLEQTGLCSKSPQNGENYLAKKREDSLLFRRVSDQQNPMPPMSLKPHPEFLDLLGGWLEESSLCETTASGWFAQFLKTVFPRD